MTDIDSEIERINSILRNLQNRENPSMELLEIIEYYINKRVRLARHSKKYFQPYRDERGKLVLNELGDTEDDI